MGLNRHANNYNRFDVGISEMPDTIDTSTYMRA